WNKTISSPLLGKSRHRVSARGQHFRPAERFGNRSLVRFGRGDEGDGSARHRCRRLGVAPMAIAPQAPALDACTSDIGRPWEREMAVRVMTGYVAHELNHPLGTIINLANILSRRLADPVVRSKDISEHVKNIKAEAVRATSIIKNMRMLTEHKPVA